MPKKPRKKRMIVDPVEKNEVTRELNEIKNIESHPDEHLKGRKTVLLTMCESGEDKVIAQKIFLLAAKGYSRQAIRDELTIKRSLWFKMMNKETDKYPIYLSALSRGEDFAIEKVEEAMKSSALGYDYEETHEGIDGDRIISKVITKHVKADVKAQMFLLTNLKPTKYKMKQAEEITITHKKEQVDGKLLPPDVLRAILGASTTEDIAAAIAKTKPVVSVPHEEV